MPTVTELELLERLCADPLLAEHEAAFGVQLADDGGPGAGDAADGEPGEEGGDDE